MEIDLKDGFFSIPIDDKLSKLFGFTYGVKRFRWGRLPQGWKWSSVLFHERIAEILDGLICPQYSDNVLVGAATLDELRRIALKVFARFEAFGIKVNYEKIKWVTTEITFLGYEIKDGKWSLEKFLTKRMQEIGEVRSIKDLERVIGILSYSRRCVKGVERILGPLREDLKTFKAGDISDKWRLELNQKVHDAFRSALDNVQWLTLPGFDSDRFIFKIESDWSSGYAGYLLYACQGDEVRLVDLGSRAHGLNVSSYLGELDAIVWASKRTKAYRGSAPLIIQTDSHSILSKGKSDQLYQTDVRAFRRWSWLLATEPGFEIRFVPGSENTGSDLLSRPSQKCDERSNHDAECQVPRIHKVLVDGLPCAICSTYVKTNVLRKDEDLQQEVWSEHLKSHWGPYKVYWALRRRGVAATWKMVRKVCHECEICAKFRVRVPHVKWGQPPISLMPGHTLYADVVGPLKTGLGGAKYIHCLIDSATRMGNAMKLRSTGSKQMIRGMDLWIKKYGHFKRLVTDNAPYYRSEEFKKWCGDHAVSHIFTAPYRHQSVGIVERYHKTLIDRIRRLRLAHGGSWTQYLGRAVDALNEAVHSVTGFTPKDLWTGTLSMRRIAQGRTIKEREYRSKKRRIYPAHFRKGQVVLVFDDVAASSREDKFSPRWKGPYVLVERISSSMWRDRSRREGRRGRKPILQFHEDQMQPFDLDDD